MGVKTYRPYTPSRRHMSGSTFEELTTDKPYKPLLEYIARSGGRNAHGHMTSRHRGGGHKRMYRKIDFFRRDKEGVAAKVLTIEYDPNRSARISLVEYAGSEKRYILAPDGLHVGDSIMTGDQAEVQTGNHLPLRLVPPGIPIHNLELFPGRGAQIVRCAGSAATIQSKEGEHAHVKLPSGEVRIFKLACYATIGQVSNTDHNTRSLGKAGRSRWLGRRPHVRGLAMNPVDHPHGGGEGKSGQGNPHPVSPWGMPTKGFKTRKRKKYSNRWIVQRKP